MRVFVETAPWEVKQINHHTIFCEHDSLLGWRKIPNKSGLHATNEYQVIERFNSKGIRGPEYSYEKSDEEYRILILGDSFAEGYTVEFNDLFSEVLKKKLNKGGQYYHEVINIGTGGYSTDQELLFFQIEGKKYNPDFTILMFYDNDIWSNTQRKHWREYKPLYKLKSDVLILTNVPVPEPETTSNKTSHVSGKRSLFRILKHWFNYNSYLYVYLRDRIKNNHFLFSLAIKHGLTEPREINSVSIPDQFKVYEKVYNKETIEAWTITEALINKLNEEVVSIKSKFLIFYVPSRASIYAEDWQATERKYGISSKDWDVNHVAIELENICESNNIDFINPTEIFKAEAKKLKSKGKRLYFVEDRHWNIDGHKLVGEILAKYIASNYIGFTTKFAQ